MFNFVLLVMSTPFIVYLNQTNTNVQALNKIRKIKVTFYFVYSLMSPKWRILLNHKSA